MNPPRVNEHTGGGIEREVKLGAWPGFELPDLAAVVPGLVVTSEPDLALDAVYYDTADLSMIRHGVTLRRREGEGPTRWTLKLPGGTRHDGVLLRRELDVDDDAAEAPVRLARLVTGYVRSAPLVPVAHLRQSRRRSRLTGADGHPLGEIDDDEVSVLEGEHVAARFREVELEFDSRASEDLVTLLTTALVEAGAGAADPTPKVVRALGPRALATADPSRVDVGPDASTAEVVQAGIANAVVLVLEHDHVVRLDDDVEGVHRARVGTRRLRSNLRTFARLLDADRLGDLRDELRWFAAELGRVRDADVLLERLWSDVERLPEVTDRGDAALLLHHLQDERNRLLASLLDAMDTPRYVGLLDRLVDLAGHPPLTRAAGRKALDVFPPLVRRRWKRLRHGVAALSDEPSDTDLHAIRILAKRVRYAADIAAPVVGPEAHDLARALAHLQDVLGDLHDTAVAGAWLRRAALVVPRPQAVAAGELIARQEADAARLRGLWPQAWAAVDQDRLTDWLS